MKHNNFLDAFPPPEFIDIPYTGISISDDIICCVRFKKNGDKLVLEKYLDKQIPAGVVSSGIINNVGELLKILKSLKKELDIKYARVSLPEEKAYLFTTTIPLVSKNEVRSTIEFKLEENVPLPAGEIVFDYIITNPVKYKDSLEVVVSACPAVIVSSYAQVVEDAGISLLSLEIKSQAISRALLSKNDTKTYMIIHTNPGKVGLYIVSSGVVHFTSTIISEGESLESPTFLSNEIKKLNTYWNSLKENENKKDRWVSQVIVCGNVYGESMIPYLSAHQDIPVVFGNVWQNVFNLEECLPPISFMDSLKYATAIGLAIPMDILI